jgi:3-hydroxymyristoyl/3-hydroxydecanoyl-(acyl carrier protein) dehydratase
MSLCELTRTAIQDLIPHRDPFLFLESARVESGNKISGLAVWSKAHPILQGHFPQKPVVPGVCLIEAGAQLAGVLLRWQSKNLPDSQNGLGVLASVQKAKFKHVLASDELLMLHCRVRALSRIAYGIQCVGTFQENLIFECELMIAQVSKALRI